MWLGELGKGSFVVEPSINVNEGDEDVKYMLPKGGFNYDDGDITWKLIDKFPVYSIIIIVRGERGEVRPERGRFVECILVLPQGGTYNKEEITVDWSKSASVLSFQVKKKRNVWVADNSCFGYGYHWKILTRFRIPLKVTIREYNKLITTCVIIFQLLDTRRRTM